MIAWFLQIKRVKDDSVYIERGQFTMEMAMKLEEYVVDKIDQNVHYTTIEQKEVCTPSDCSRCCEAYSWSSPCANICELVCKDFNTGRCKYYGSG